VSNAIIIISGAIFHDELMYRLHTSCREWCCMKVDSRQVATTRQWCCMIASGITVTTCTLRPCNSRQPWLHLLQCTCVYMYVKVCWNAVFFMMLLWHVFALLFLCCGCVSFYSAVLYCFQS